MLLAAVALLVHAAPLFAQQSGGPTLYRPGHEELRVASATWDFRRGPDRIVADVVCLVPDVPTFLEALSTWDRGHAFPILLDDADTALKFIRAFRPARVVRFPKVAKPLSGDALWSAAVAAVGRSWRDDGQATPPAGDAVPRFSAPTPPGVVLSDPKSPTLAGAAALAAGRFQPLLRMDVSKTHTDVLGIQEAAEWASALQGRIENFIPKSQALGDECDFLTLAGDWPYRYTLEKGPFPGPAAIDDLLGREGRSGRRWAYCGRLLGDPVQGVYEAMSALFLQPESATLLNTYDEADPPWAPYAMGEAAKRLTARMKVARRSAAAERPTPGWVTWHRAFDPWNRAGLLLINTKGGPSDFDIAGSPGITADIPATEPTALHMIHSFSAADPFDIDTLAGRWVDGGAFVYFGSVSEPGLTAFRTPTVVADLITDGLPLVAAFRQGPSERFGMPWKLIYLGDPLYRVASPARRPKRDAWSVIADWPAYAESPAPSPDAADSARLVWALKTAIARAAKPPATDLVDALLAIRRDRLSPNLQPSHDALAFDILMHAGRTTDLRKRLASVRSDALTPRLRRYRQTAQAADLTSAITARDFGRATSAWEDIVRSDAPESFKRRATERTTYLARETGRLTAWGARLRSASAELKGTPADAILSEARDKVDAMGGARRRP